MSRGVALSIRSRATRSGNAGSCAYGEVFAIPPTRSGRGGTKDLGHSCPRQSGHLQSQPLPTSWQYPMQPRHFANPKSPHPQAPPLRSAACGSKTRHGGWHPEIVLEHHVMHSPLEYTTLALNRDCGIKYPFSMAHESALPNRVARLGCGLDRPRASLLGIAL